MDVADVACFQFGWCSLFCLLWLCQKFEGFGVVTGLDVFGDWPDASTRGPGLVSRVSETTD